MRRKIRIKFTDFWPLFNPNDNIFINILKTKYDVEISDKPEYIISSVFGTDYLKYDGIRICFTGENLHIDFNVFDYGMGFDYLQFGDRYLRFPLYMLYPEQFEKALHKHEIKDDNEYMAKHNRFCNFVYSNGKFAMPQRTELFEILNEYKRVDSGGRYLNNIGKPVKDKGKFLSNYKFTIAVENTSTPGYTSEKLIEGWTSQTIPIYYGNPEIGREFNTEAFINCHDYNNFDEVIAKVKELDNDNDKFMKMMRTPICNNQIDFRNSLMNFLQNIIEQDYESAFRRDRFGYGKINEMQKKRMERYSVDGIVSKVGKVIRGIKK